MDDVRFAGFTELASVGFGGDLDGFLDAWGRGVIHDYILTRLVQKSEFECYTGIMLRLISWNVNGLRSVLRKGDLQDLMNDWKPDVLCLQETKAKQGQAEVDWAGYDEIWNDAKRAGYSGTAIWTNRSPLGVWRNFEDFEGRESLKKMGVGTDGDWGDDFGNVREEGRVLTAEYEDFFLVNVYVPNAKPDLARLKLREGLWDPMLLRYVVFLEAKKPVVMCGDFNVAHEEIDLARPKENRGNAGFTDEERQGLTNLLTQSGLVDIWRLRNPERKQYSWWSFRAGARARNVGWRIDYFLVSEVLAKRVSRIEILDEVLGSDHAPLLLEID